MRLLATLVVASLALAQAPEAISRGLRPPVVVEGRPEVQWSVTERLAHYKVPAVSVAVIEKGKIAWAQAWGNATQDSLFQAASISKPLAAMAALKLVEQGKLSLDEDVNAKLKTWKLPASDAANGKPITLRRILSHSAGLTVHGFPGYEQGAKIPSVPQILDGVEPANTKAIRVDIEPGTKWRYSGGGYTLMQLLVEDVAGKPFAAVMKELILDPAGMKASTYEQPLPGGFHAKVARAHDGKGDAVVGGWNDYPEQAAAGLWTNPSDLARLLIAVPQAKLLSSEMTNEMLTAQQDAYGLGWSLRGKKNNPNQAFEHGGANRGYRCFAFAYRNRGQGAVIMTNGDQGGPLAQEIVRAIATHYKWNDFQPDRKTLLSMSAGQLSKFAGEYRANDMTITMSVADGGLSVVAGPSTGQLLPESDVKFFPIASGMPNVTFEKDADGNVTGFRAGQLSATKVR